MGLYWRIITDKTCYYNISRSLAAARLSFKINISLQNLTVASHPILSTPLSNFRVITVSKRLSLSWLWYFIRSFDETPNRSANRGRAFVIMMTPYWLFVGEPSGHWWISLTKASDTEHWCFLWSVPEQTNKQLDETLVFSDNLRPFTMLIYSCYIVTVVMYTVNCRK